MARLGTPLPSLARMAVSAIWPSMSQLDKLVYIVESNWRPCSDTITEPPYVDLIYQVLQVVPDPILFMVSQQLYTDRKHRLYKPTIGELKRMCICGMRIRPLLRDRFGLDVDDEGEPWLPPPKRRRPRVHLDD
jgi:hypothetical protein